MKRTIENRDDIKLMVEDFYEKVKKDDVIGDIFNNVLYFKWDTHIPIMIDFWESVLLEGTQYKGNTMRKHIELDQQHPLKPEHFERWEKLFFETLDELFTGPKVEEAKNKAELMATLMQLKITRSKDSNFIL